jgi:hypothetical protein
MPTYRISAVNKEGKPFRRSFDPDHYSPKQLKQIEIDFKKWVKAGGSHLEFIIPSWHNLDPENENVEKSKLKKSSHFETMHIKDLDLPENGAMSFCCIGSTRSGKSYAINYIYENMFKKHITLLMTLSSHADVYKGFRKNAVICDGFKSQLIEEPMKINKETKNHYNFCLIFDDLVMDGKNDRSMTKLLTIGRNCGMSAIISGQKLSMLSATGRSNINYVLCFKQNSEMAIEDTIKTFLRSYMPKDMKMNEMIRLYKELTDDHHYFLIDTLNDKCYISKI